ncbi:hypothetical protein E2C01_052667 [Portunus trituberculatus]|uniref:Uncharacterized protein n=1 Tax=Portunus trituberculatus TaxID=210409 RepID=A0A5B7GF94_PORTR|nr:hypothetical protein [Portunus trituberculatus]
MGTHGPRQPALAPIAVPVAALPTIPRTSGRFTSRSLVERSMHKCCEREMGSVLSSPATSWGRTVFGRFSTLPSSGPPRFEGGTKRLMERLCLIY